MATRTTKTTSTTKTTRTSAAKPKTTTSTTTKTTSAAKAAAPTAPVVVDSPTPVVAGPMMRKKELIDAVVAKSGLKKKDVKPAVEATLAVLGSALQDGRELNLQPLGKIKVNREKKLAAGKMMIARIRQSQDLPTQEAHPDPKDLDDATDAPAAAE
ncbi:HU family DNA-binding protein [Tateyamaria sp. SN3-11]|uniref:HU family DNA-binding protein n=1 Tax=Tateyamaria sp. SN3-11 TaxID=3092147 RepID=UPI0039EC2647